MVSITSTAEVTANTQVCNTANLYLYDMITIQEIVSFVQSIL